MQTTCSPRVAVVIPTRRRPDLLVQALGSVLAQTYRALEVVVMDVGGRSWSARAESMVQETEIAVRRVIAEEPTFAGRARNLGVEESEAPILAFLDDDDIWYPRYLYQAIASLTVNEGAVVVTPFVVRKGRAMMMWPRLPLPITADDVLSGNPGVTGSNVVLERRTFIRVGAYDERLSSWNDLDLLVRMLDAGIELVEANAPLVEQRLHDGPQLGDPTTERLAALTIYRAKYADRLSPRQRRSLDQQQHWMLAHVAPTRLGRFGHRVMDVYLTPSKDLVTRVRRRLKLVG